MGIETIAAGPWMPLLIALPLAAACAMLVLPRQSAALGVLGSLLILAATAGLTHQVILFGPQQVAVGGWDPPLGIRLRADGPAVGMAGITGLIGLFVGIYATAFLRPPADAQQFAGRLFWPLWMFLWAGLNALFFSADLFNLYVAVEVVGIASVALAALAGTAAAVSAAVRYLLVSLLGSLAYLMGMALVYAAEGSLALRGLSAAPFSYAALALMSTGLSMKTALFPLHVWLPPAHANAPAPVSALLSALVVKASFYVMLRLWFELFAPLIGSATAHLPGLLGAAAILWGSLQAFAAKRLKQLIAYSTVAQVGYLFLVFPLGMAGGSRWAAWSAVLYFILAHALAKAAVFLAAGNVLRAFGHDRITDLGGAVQQLPISMFAFAVAGVSLVGLPPSGGFIAKWLFLAAALEAGKWGYATAVVGGGLLATAYVFRFFSHAFRTIPERVLCGGLPRRMEWCALALAFGSLALGLTAEPILAMLQIGLAPAGAAGAGGLP